MAVNVENSKHTPNPIGREAQPPRERAWACASPERGSESSFLNHMFESIQACEIPHAGAIKTVEEDGKEYWLIDGEKIDAEANIQYLTACTERYSKLSGLTMELKPGQNLLKALAWYAEIIQNAMPADCDLVIDYDHIEKRLEFLEYCPCDYTSNILFFLPVSFVKRLPGYLKQAVREALGYIVVCNGINSPWEHPDLQFAIDTVNNDEFLEGYKGEEERKGYKDMVASYNDGEACDLICSCQCFPQSVIGMKTKLEIALEQHSDDKYTKLLNYLKQGVAFAEEDRICNYLNSPEYCELARFNSTDQFMDARRMFAIVYDLNDEVVEQAIDYLNGEVSSMEMDSLYFRRVLTPDMEELFHKSDFPKRWTEWFCDLTEEINKL